MDWVATDLKAWGGWLPVGKSLAALYAACICGKWIAHQQQKPVAGTEPFQVAGLEVRNPEESVKEFAVGPVKGVGFG